MAGFTVVSEPMNTGWYPVHYDSETLYVGQIVTLDVAAPDYGLKAWNVAGIADTTVNQIPFGVVIGFNNKTPVFNTTYKGEYGTSVSTVAAQLARDWTGAEGMWSKGDPALLAQVALIDPTTVIRGRIFNAAYGTACAVSTNTTADATGATITTVATTAGVAANKIWYCRTGANAGLYRVSYSTSTTSHTFYLTWPNGIAVGDTFVGVTIALGTCKMDCDNVATYIEQFPGDANSYGTDYFWANVLNVNLANAGGEYATFRINPTQLMPVART